MGFLQLKICDSPRQEPPTKSESVFYCSMISIFMVILLWTSIDVVANGWASAKLEGIETSFGFLPIFLIMMGASTAYGCSLAALPRWIRFVVFPAQLAFALSAHLSTGLVSMLKNVPWFNDQTGLIWLFILGAFPVCLAVVFYISREFWIAQLKNESVRKHSKEAAVAAIILDKPEPFDSDHQRL